FQMLTVGAHATAMALGQTKSLFLRNFIAFLFNIPVVIIATIEFELVGASFARAGTIVLIVLLNLQLARELVGATYFEQIRNSFRTVLSCALMVSAVLAFRTYWAGYDRLDELLRIGAVGLVGAGVYIASHLMMWVLQNRPDGIEATLLGLFRKPAAGPEG
ncbi:MAG: polysaccharide biosynthesis C-terminal domain-containing protein, partial [Henriciella sp.]